MYYDKDFLRRLDKERNRDIYARITLLTKDEYPVEYIEGKVTGGSINIDGTSSLRRTCNLSMVSANLDANIFYLGLERKFILEIGLENKIDSSYPDIIWFKEGIFVTTGVTTSRSASNYNISINGKDKMCLLNGDVSGNLPYSVVFDTLEEISEDGTTVTKTKVKIKDIIRHAVEELGGELPYNIIINDLEDAGLTLLDYKGNNTAYAFKIYDLDTFTNITFDEDTEFWAEKTDKVWEKLKIKNLEEKKWFIFNPLLEDLNMGSKPPTRIAFKENPGKDDEIYSLVKIKHNLTIGYRLTEVIYPDELIGNIGDSLTSVLDKLVEMLVNYEYFYDIDGRFIFQKKRTLVERGKPYLGENNINIAEKEALFYANKENTKLFYNFEDNDLVVSFNNNPDFNNVKNDFSIWGTRKGISDAELPVHLRFALDRKPSSYVTYKPAYVKIKSSDGDKKEYLLYENYPLYEYRAGLDGSWNISDKPDLNGRYIITCDWREIIYLMALDYYKFKDTLSDFYLLTIHNNIDPKTGVSRYPTGRTQYEQYYTDILGFWRELYSPVGAGDNIIYPDKKEESYKGFFKLVLLSPSTYKMNLYYTKEKEYKTETITWTDTLNHIHSKDVVLDEDMVDRFPVYHLDSSRKFDENKIYYQKSDDITEIQNDENEVIGFNYFNSKITDDPTSLNFWFDFLDTQGDLGKYSVRAIGLRPKDVNNSNVKSIYYRETPNLIFRDPYSSEVEEKIFYNAETEEEKRETIYADELLESTAYTYINSNIALENCLTISTQGVSAMDTLLSYLNEFTFCKENTTLTTIPVYYMEPNVRVSIKDSISKVNGEYIVDKITIPLAYNGTMSMNVVKVIDEIR